MLVTKREVKRTSKKLLSVLLAVIMMMTSMSVCFGPLSLTASAANDTGAVSAFVSAMQCDAMKRFNPTTTNASNADSITYTYNAGSYADYVAISNVISKLDAAIKGLDEYKNGATHNGNKVCSDGWVDKNTYIVPESKKNECTDTGYLLKYLEDAIDDTQLKTLKDTYNFGKLCDAVFSTHQCQYRNADGNQDDTEGDIASSSVPDELTNVLIVETDKINEKLTDYASVSAIPDDLEVQTSYTIKMYEQNWTSTKTSGCTTTTINHRHIAINTNNHTPTVAKSSVSTKKSALVTAENTLNANAYYNAADVAAVLSLSSNNVKTLETAKSTLEGVKTTLNNDALFNHFFGTKYNKAIKNIDEAMVVLSYKDTVDAINEYYSVDFMRMNKDEVKAHLDAFKAAYGTFTALSDSAQATIVSSYGLDTAAVEAKIQEVQNRYDYLCVIEIKNEADGFIATYTDWTIDNVDDGSVTSAMLTVAAANLIRVIAGLEAYDAALITAVAGADYIKNLTALKQNIDKLGKAAGYNDSFLAEYAEFTARIEAVTSTNSTTLFNALVSYDSWYTDLKALISTMYTELGTTDAEKLFDDLNNTMVAHMNAAYKELNTRTEVQINVAYDLYDAHKAAYGATVHYVSLESYYILRNSIGLIDTNAYNFLNNSGNFDIPAETVKKYNELQSILPKYDQFVATKGFGTYETLEIDDITREEKSDEEIFRDKDYTVTDELVLDIIDTLEAALADPEIKAILGKLINKETGEPFDIAALLSGLISDGLFSDSLINTIIQFIYPAVANIFTEVWMGIDPVIDDPEMDVMGQKLAVKADLYLNTVEVATEGLGLPIFPTSLAKTINSNYSQFSNVATLLAKATTPSTVQKDAEGNWDESTRKSPWNDAVLYTDKVDKDGNVIKNEETGETTKVLALDWGIDELEGAAKRERFLQAIQAALIGLEPILLALLCNKEMNAFNPSIGTGSGNLYNYWIGTVIKYILDNVNINRLPLNIHTIDLRLSATANDGYNNVIAPLFELLGVTAPDGKTFRSTRDVIEKGLLEPLDAVIAKIAANPIETILEILPNLTYAIEADLLLTKLDYLSIDINYSAGATIDADLNTAEFNTWIDLSKYIKYLSDTVSNMTGLPCENGIIKNVRVDDVVADALPVAISSFLDINALLGEGVDLSSFAGIWNLVSGLLGEDLELPAPNAAYIAMLGKLTEIPTVRSIKSYNWGTPGKAAHIVANKADVLIYLVKYALESGLLGALVANPNELVNTLFTNLATNSEDAIAAIAELLNQETIYDAKTYSWYDGTIDGESVVGNSAYEIYLNPGNDWTKDKANYLYNNLDAIVAQILTLAKVDLDKTTEDVDGSLGEVIGGAIGGLLSDKTLTALAGALAGLDLNALLAPKADAEAGEGEDTTPPDASEPETVAEGEGSAEGEEGEEETEAAAPALDIEALLNSLLGIDLSTFRTKYGAIAEALEADETYVYNFGVDDGDKTFAKALAEIIAPFEDVINFILVGGNLKIKLDTETVTLLGAAGYNNGLIPLLEALGIDAVAATEDKTGAQVLEYVVNALVTRINTLTTGNVIQNIVNLLPGVFYFITSNGLSTTVLNLLQPVLVIVDTIRPIVDVMAIINNLEVGEEGAKQKISELLGGPINLERLDLGFIFDLLPALIPGFELDLSGLVNVIYDICNNVGVEYTSKTALANTVNGKAKKGALNANFDGADLLTVVLSFVLEWATVKENAEALDELLGTNGIIAALDTVFADIEIEYGTPDWMYWFETEEEFNDYVNGSVALPNTLAALTYPNDWNEETAQYIADELPELVDMVIALINKDKGEDAPATLSALLNKLIADNINADTLNKLVGMIAGLLEGVDNNLLELAGYILGDSSTEKKEIDIVGLKAYKCEAKIEDLSDFINELANVLDTYASGLINWLFFGDDFRFAKKSDNTDTIVINGGLGYEKGLALILEALGCDAPAADEATTANVLAALAARVNYLLTDDVDDEGNVTMGVVDKVIDLLPNLVYFLNADGASVAVNNLLAPVYALLNKINSLGLLEKEINLAELLGFDLKYLSLADILALVTEKTGLDLSAAEEILVNLCIGKIEKGTYTYKMTADRKDTITVILTTALMLVSDEDFAKKLDEMLGTEIISAIKTVFESVKIEYMDPEWYALDWDTVDYEKKSVGVVQSALTYPNDWTAEKSLYLADNLSSIVDTVIGMIEINGVKYDSLAALIDANVNIYTPDLFTTIQKAIGDLLGGLEGDLQDLVNVGFGAADKLLGADIQGLLDYDASGVNDKASFVAALTDMLMKVEGIVEWLLLGKDYELFVDDKNDNGKYDAGEAIITLNGAEGYAQGLSLVLEALGVKDLPAATGKTREIVNGVLKAVFNRVDEILANPVNEVINILPNVIYFINTNGLAAAVNNLAAAFNSLALKLKAFGLNITLADLLNIESLLKIYEKNEAGEVVLGEDGKPVVKDLAIGLDKLNLTAVLEVVAELTGLDLAGVADIFVGFALGRVYGYKGVNGKDNAKMAYDEGEKGRFNKGDMMTLIVTAALLVVNAEGNDEKLDALLKTNGIVAAIKAIIASNPIVDYATPNWNYMNGKENDDVIEYVNEIVDYPNDWTEEKAEYLAENLPDLVDTVIQMVEIKGVKYESLSRLLEKLLADSNIFTAETLNDLVDLIAGLLGDIDDGLLSAAGVLLGADIVGLKAYKAPETVDTVDEFAAELTLILNKYAKGVVEWLLLGRDYRFFVSEGNGDAEYNYGEDAITINGAHGYAEGLALLLEALGCENLPTVYDKVATTEAIVSGVLASLAKRIDEIIANPVEEVLDLLPNLIYFLDANGVAVVIENTTAALMNIIGALEPFNVKLDINSLVDLPKLMGIADKYEEGEKKIGLDNLTLVALLRAVSLMTGLDLTELQNVLVPFALGEAVKYDSVSASDAYKMVYKTNLDKHDMITVLVTAILNVATAEGNEEAIKALLGENADIYDTILGLISGAEITYSTPDWDYCLDENGFKPGESTPVIESAIKYPNDWNKEAVQYLTDNLPALVDEVVKMISKDDEASLSKILTDNVNVFNADTLNSLVKEINKLLSGIDAGLIEAAGILLDVKLVGENSLATYVAPKEVDTVEEFAAELAKVLTTYAGGVVEWLLLGDSYTFFVNDDGDGKYTAGEDVITIKGGHGYAEGLALLLEALGCENLPAVYDENGEALDLDTTAVVNGVLNSLAARITEIFANPVKEVIDLLPNLLYFLNANGVAAVVDNLTAALTALLNELTVFGINLDINSLINIPKLMGIADKYKEGEKKIGLDNLTLKDILKAVSLMTGLDLTVLEAVLADFALGEVAEYNSVSAKAAYKMSYSDEFDKHHMMTVLLTSVLLAVFETEGNAEKLAEMLDTDIITAIDDVFNSVEITYNEINWNYAADNDGDYMLTYPNNWNKDTATAVAELLKDKEIEALIAGLIDANYDSFSALLNDKVNIFTAENLQAIVDLIANLLKDIDDGLLKAAGLLLDVDVVGLKAYKAPETVDTVGEFADELAKVLTTYARGIVEWLLLGEDYRFFVKDVDANGVPVDFITIDGANGYTEGLAVLLEALGVAAPAVIVKDGVVDTKATVEAVLKAVADRIDAIFANPVAEVIALLPNIIYFLNTDGVAVVIDNTIAALTALLAKLAGFGLKVDINELVNLPKLMKIEDKYVDGDDVISLDNITIKSLLKAVSLMVEDLDLTVIESVLVGFDLGTTATYATVSATEAGKAKKMTLADADTVTIIANLLLLTVKDTDNAEFLKGLVGDKIYDMIMSLFNLETKAPQDFDWLYKDKEGEVFSTLTTSGVYDDWPLYGPHYTEEMATYIADNFGMFVDNILYLLGLEINGVQINDLTTLINELLDGSLYNSSNVIAIRDALAGVLASLADLEVNGKNVGKHIVAVLKAAKIADLEAVGKVEVAEFTESREKFVAAICDVLAPLYPVLKWLLADEDIAFFVDAEKKDLITLPGAEGYAFGIIPILEVLGCDGIIAPETYYNLVDADGSVLITSILDVLLDRVDEIIENPADEILGILPNLIYFINSKGLDTVFKNTLSAVYTILDAINPLVEIDLYKLIGIDLKKIDMNYLVEELLKLLADLGYNFKTEQLDPIAELTVGKLEKYTSANGKEAYRMVYDPEVGAGGGSAELVTVILRLAVTFLMHEKNATLVVDFLSNNLGMSPDARNYLLGIIKSIAKVPTTTFIGMDQALAVIYYLFYSADIGAGSVAGGLKDINAEWGIILKELSVSDNPEEETIGSILKDLMDKYTGDVLEEDGVAPNGLIKFFQKIADWFNSIIEWFKNLFK